MEGVHLKKLIIVLLCIPLLLLAACSSEKENAKTTKKNFDMQPESVKINSDSELLIVPLYTQYQKYLEASLATDDMEQKKENYKKFVLDYIEEIGKKENLETADLKGNFLLSSTAYEKELLNRIDGLVQRHDEVKETVTKNYIAANKVLPKKKSTIFLIPVNSEFLPVAESMGGVSGAAYKNTYALYLDENFDKKVLAYTTAHEYHHLILYDKPDFKVSSVLKSVITEGKADAFADRVVKDVSPPWNEPMDEKTKKHVASLVNDYQTTFNDFVIGNEQKGIPRWSNYILGRDILNHYLKSHPNVPIAEWTSKEDNEILDGYKYQELLQ